MRFGVKSVNTAKARAKSGPIARAARAAVTMAARRDTEPFVPRVAGDLRQTAHTQSKPDDGELAYGDGGRVRYARPQYYDHPHKTLPGTMMRWFEHAKPMYMRNVWLKEGEAAAREAARRG